MTMPFVASITAAEERLRTAMLASDVDALRAMLAPDLVFTNHVGQLLDRQADLESHRSGALKLRAMTPSETRIQVHGGAAVVSVRMRVEGAFAGVPFAEDFRYTRVWHLSDDAGWRVVAAHMSVVQA